MDGLSAAEAYREVMAELDQPPPPEPSPPPPAPVRVALPPPPPPPDPWAWLKKTWPVLLAVLVLVALLTYRVLHG